MMYKIGLLLNINQNYHMMLSRAIQVLIKQQMQRVKVKKIHNTPRGLLED